MFFSRKLERALVMSSEPLIEIANLSKCYGLYDQPWDRLKQFFYPKIQQFVGSTVRSYCKEFWALKNINLRIYKGETIGLIGKNGSGKSTLLQLICGTLTPTVGSVVINARIACLLELGSGFNPEFTGRENIYLNGALLGLSVKEIETRYLEIIDFAEIGEFIDQPLKTYSTGMMLRLAFAVIAHVDAELLVIDEALAVGDVFFNQKCMRFLREFQKSKTIILVSHDTASIQSLCTRAVLIKGGEVVSDGDPKGVCERYLEEFFESTQKIQLPNSFSQNKRCRNVNNFTDQRQKYLNYSNLRNDLRIFSFNHDSSSFGSGKAKIIDAEFLDDLNNHLSWIVGGEKVTIAIDILSLEDVSKVIVGFFIKDRFGQSLFGDNTFLSPESTIDHFSAGASYKAQFSFVMPILAAGDYSVTIAVASGTPDDHSQLHWMHDAIVFKSESSRVGTGLIGVPMLEISMNKIDERL